MSISKFKEEATESLLEKELITIDQFEQVKAYRNLNLFSLHTELKLFLYASVILFTTGIGILIYQNIDSIGHIAILAFLLLVIVICFYFCFKNSIGFKKQQTQFENPIFDYLILAAVLLSCIFVGYLQFQYAIFGTHYGLATVIPTAIAFFCAYYFDNKSILSIAITGLAAYIGLSVSPQSLLQNEFNDNNTLSYSAISLGISLVIWTIYSEKNDLKKHFNLVFLTFALHIISIACINNLSDSYWGIFILLLAGSCYYFYRTSYLIKSVSLFVFTLIYAYIGLNIFLFKLLEFSNINSELFIPLFFLVPFYFIGSIIYFIRLVKQFNKKTNHDSI
ncbi:DUF2157 domain-containing protein [Flavobacterium glaciei]|uniref:Membrane protein DUF2157 n=1 Tax=Flavobacterium glaciei TaxID=386300 RepID=A0A562PV07_9FLAO|nr:DUF2157 domain-containing protein [Flavobacterium glaciei]RDI56298.1 putative membrane protein DUF2157 [Flavobacterium glaciei]TWI48208.1 putative membrane protein DUF2157 [Flavobacterium glaciei]